MDRGVPVLGVCLGMQAIHVLDGGALVNMNEPLHGRVTRRTGITNCRAGGPVGDLSASMEVGHYHSWVVDESTGSYAYNTIAHNAQGWPMVRFHCSPLIACSVSS